MKKNEILQIRLTFKEKNIIKNKAAILNLSVTDYVLKCCLYSNATQIFINKMYKNRKKQNF